MDNLWLIKVGEITLKKGNRAFFERLLKENIRKKLKLYSDTPGNRSKISGRAGRFFLETDCSDIHVTRILETTPGVVGFSKTLRVAKNMEDLAKASEKLTHVCMGANLGNRFKLEVRRSDKSLALDSYGYARELGSMLLKKISKLKVDVHEPDFIIHIELREWGYVYSTQNSGPGGLPVGSSGCGMLLLSGGIDSPVAGYMMAKRGMKLRATHFHTPPYTSNEALKKVKRLAALLAPWCGGLTLILVPFTQCQIHIRKSVHPSAITLHSRACMMMIAEKLSEENYCRVLITGESLGQVASQTQESMSFTEAATAMSVFRPLIGLDKEEIVALARHIGTFETAIEPFEDCCTLFSSEKPLTRPNIQGELAVYKSIEGLEELANEAVKDSIAQRFDARGNTLLS